MCYNGGMEDKRVMTELMYCAAIVGIGVVFCISMGWIYVSV